MQVLYKEEKQKAQQYNCLSLNCHSIALGGLLCNAALPQALQKKRAERPQKCYSHSGMSRSSHEPPLPVCRDSSHRCLRVLPHQRLGSTGRLPLAPREVRSSLSLKNITEFQKGE